MAMTSPVTLEMSSGESQKIAMTSPVTAEMAPGGPGAAAEICQCHAANQQLTALRSCHSIICTIYTSVRLSPADCGISPPCRTAWHAALSLLPLPCVSALQATCSMCPSSCQASEFCCHACAAHALCTVLDTPACP